MNVDSIHSLGGINVTNTETPYIGQRSIGLFRRGFASVFLPGHYGPIRLAAL